MSDDVTSFPSPRALLLRLFLAARDEPFTAREAVAACALFGISENAARVTLARLVASAMIEPAGRGAYRLSPRAADFANEIATWRDAEKRLRKWNEKYVAVHCGGLGRTDRAALRRRDRAMRLLGMRELSPGLFLRPDNLEGGVDGARARLTSLGLDAEAVVFTAGAFDDEREQQIRALWDGEALNRGYAMTAEQLDRWLDRAHGLAPDASARESFLLGDRAIRQLVFDPLLPEPLVDTDARREFIVTLRRFDAAGRAIWRDLYRTIARDAAAGTVLSAAAQ
jgi:phenylacetic acid degradation operon negative regulatory protein